MMCFDRVIGASLILLGVPLLAKADQIFNDYGPGHSYVTNHGWTVGVQGEDWVPAAAFVPSANYILTQIDLSVGHGVGINSFNIFLLSSSGSMPGAVIEAWTGIAATGGEGQPGIVEIVTPVGDVALVSGIQYWTRCPRQSSIRLAGTKNMPP